MVISRNSQLGLMMDDTDIAVEFLQSMIDRLKMKQDTLKKVHELVKDELNEELTNINELLGKIDSGEIEMSEEQVKAFLNTVNEHKSQLGELPTNEKIRHRINEIFTNSYEKESKWLNFIDNKDSKLYLICNGVEMCSKMIRIGDNFSSKALRNIHFGKHTYLLGKNEMCRFLCYQGAIKGVYWNRESKITFEFGFDLTSDDYYFDEDFSEQFNRVAKIITFVELGDIDIIMLEKGRNNGKLKSDGKVTNTSEYTVYVVDSSWNKLIIRTAGFAVMGHFRLQPCGAGLIDRKLIWINAFEKHGYKRQPKASILNN